MSNNASQPPPLHYNAPPMAAPRPHLPLRRLLTWALFIGLAVFLFLLLSQRTPAAIEPAAGEQIALSDFVSRLEANQVRTIAIGRSEVRGEFSSPQTLPDGRSLLRFRTPLPEGMGESWAFVEWVLATRGSAVVSVAETPNSVLMNILLPLIPWLLIFSFIWFMVFRQLRKAGKNQVVITGPGRWVPDPPAGPVAGPVAAPPAAAPPYATPYPPSYPPRQ